MARLDVLRRHVPCLPHDLQQVLEEVLADDIVTDDERIEILHALTGRPMDARHKGVLREAIEYWAERDAFAAARATQASLAMATPRDVADRYVLAFDQASDMVQL